METRGAWTRESGTTSPPPLFFSDAITCEKHSPAGNKSLFRLSVPGFGPPLMHARRWFSTNRRLASYKEFKQR